MTPWRFTYRSRAARITSDTFSSLDAATGGRMNLLAALAAAYNLTPDDLPPPPPWDEGLEAAMEAVANSVDPETGRPTYRPRRTR